MQLLEQISPVRHAAITPGAANDGKENGHMRHTKRQLGPEQNFKPLMQQMRCQFGYALLIHQWNTT